MKTLERREVGKMAGCRCIMNGQCGCQKDMAKLFSVVYGSKIRGNGHKLEHRKFCTSMQRNFFTMRVTEHCHWLPREVVHSPLKIFKTCLDTYLCSLL